MVIDLTRRPVFINTDICVKHVVIRTAKQTGGVDGRIMRRIEKGSRTFAQWEEVIKDWAYLRIGASKDGPSETTIMEYRLPVHDIVWGRRKKMLFDPYEVATLHWEGGKRGAWRVHLTINYATNPNGVVWFITVRDEGAKLDLLTATLKEVFEHRKLADFDHDDLLPLERLARELPSPGKRRTVWDLLRQNHFAADDGEP